MHTGWSHVRHWARNDNGNALLSESLGRDGALAIPLAVRVNAVAVLTRD